MPTRRDRPVGELTEIQRTLLLLGHDFFSERPFRDEQDARAAWEQMAIQEAMTRIAAARQPQPMPGPNGQPMGGTGADVGGIPAQSQPPTVGPGQAPRANPWAGQQPANEGMSGGVPS